jgi:hypothetical protein
MARGESGSRFESQRYTGRQHEYALFGEVNVKDPAYLADLAKVIKPDGYVNFKDAVELVKKHQPYDPANPKKDFYRELLIAVQDKLGVDPDKQPDAIRVYTAVGTPLDHKHGTDAFITLSEHGRETLVTLDASLRPEKIQEGWKADVMIGEVPDAENDDAYLDAIDGFAAQISKKLLTKTDEGKRAA